MNLSTVRKNHGRKGECKMRIKISMQYFADPAANDDDNKKNNQGNDGQNNDGQQNDGQNKSGSNDSSNASKNDKTFTQEQVSKMMAKEKNQGRNAVYNELGINPKDEEQIAKIKEFIESNKSDAQKQAEKTIAEQTALKEAEDRAKMAETKAEAMMLGVKPQYVEDAVTLALAKTSDGDVKSVLAEFKTKYPVWFETEEEKKKQAKGTGSSLKNQSDKNDDKGKEQGIGARLAAQRKSSKTKSSYWGTK